MAGFQFTNTGVTLDIAGHTFDVQATARFIRKVGECGEALLNYSQEAKGGKEPDLDAAERLLRQQIDALLGGGACEAIFEGREPDYFDTLEVWQYIVETVQAAQAQRPALKALGKQSR